MKMKPPILFFFFVTICLIYATKQQDSQVLSMQCNKKLIVTHNTPCTSCVLAIRMHCPSGWTQELLRSKLFWSGTGSPQSKSCSYTVKLAENTLSLSGCTRSCVKKIEEKQCCSGYWGSECFVCPSSTKNPCSGHGTCLDGITGNGTCICENNFGGYACQDCQDETRFGPDCQSVCECRHGICNHGISGNGQCTCYGGYTGPKCDQELPLCGGLTCDDKSHCVVKDGQAQCECLPGYDKIGMHCQAQDPCSSSPCSSLAVCKTIGPTKYECTCKYGHQGDGRICQPINPCIHNNGGCTENSTYCNYLQPGTSVCLCKPGRIGSNCQLMGGCPYVCGRNSKCEEDSDGIASCVCKEGEIGDGKSCFKTLLSEIYDMNIRGSMHNNLNTALSMFDVGCKLLLENYGPFTVFVPTNVRYLDTAQHFNVTFAHKLCRMHIIPGQHSVYDMGKRKVMWTLSGDKVIFSDMHRRKYYVYSDSPGEQYTVTHSDFAAANGIWHIVSRLRKTVSSENLGNPQKTVGEILASLEIASRFETILENCGLPSFLNGPGSFTIFVPSNEAVDKLRDGRLIYLFTEGINKLQELVKYHIYTAAAVTVEKLISMPHIMTMANQILTINVTENGRILLGDSGVALNKRNILASNGVIHTLDGIFIPPSILPILPHKCYEQQYKVVTGSCVDCDVLNSSVCPPQSTPMEHGIIQGECVYVHDPLGLNVLKKGCSRYCNQTVMIPGCCKGFFGPDCTVCPGGYTNPCYGKGTCIDGIRGNGQCHCFENFKGIACHICSNPNKHGENCDKDCPCVHGICDNRPGSKGVCQPRTCKAGYVGEFCDKKSHNCGSAGASLNCHQDAVCSLNGTARCICLEGYEGDGFSCEPIDVCRKPERGGCSENAICTSTGPGTATCQCNNGWTGDGKGCVAIDNCVMESRGGCHIYADCHYIGPGQSSCVCKRGYEGDGFNCNPIDPCLMDNGGCRDFAVCKSLGAGEVACRCSEGYMGDGDICYADIMTELARNYRFDVFFQWIQKSLFSIPKGANVTVLVPINEVVEKLNETEKDFWLKPDMLPFVVRAHFLNGSFMTGQLKKYVGQELPTLNPRIRWEINNYNGTLTIHNARVVTGDIPAINGTIYIIDRVLLPPLGDIPPQHPGLLQQLNMTLSFSRFKQLLEQYQLIGEIESSEQYTIFVPGNSSVEKYCQALNITQLDKDTVKYHVILGDKLFSKDLKNGIHKRTMLGNSYWLIFYKDTTQAYVNKILLDGQFFETRNGMLIGVSQVLPVHRNRCTTNTTTIQKTRCAKCNRKFKCPAGSVLAESGTSENLPHCEYKYGKNRLVGCQFTCIKASLVSVCCQGYYGHMCEMCPGERGNWCSGNGICQDGISGSGDCQCHEGFHGTACEMCQPGRYGPSCKAECNCKNGACNEGLLGDGSCLCNPGWKGSRCDTKIEIDLCNGTCDVNANCINGSVISQPSCVCSAGYTGNGTYCTEIDLCASGNGGCSQYANCTKVAAGQRICSCKEGYAGDGTICREIDLCLENRGGCHLYADCVKTGPGLVACNCLPSYSGDGVKACELIDTCSQNKEVCRQQGFCYKSTDEKEICICVMGMGGTSICSRTTWKEEFVTRKAVSLFFQYAKAFNIINLSKGGPYTIFVPLFDFQSDSTIISEWKRNFLLYHVVICQQLLSRDLEFLDSITTLSGQKIRVSMKENSIYLNEDAKVIDRDFVGPNANILFINKILIPSGMQNHVVSSNLSEKSIPEVAEAYGYKIFSKLIVEAGLLPLINETIHQPFTMLWPTDVAFNSLPEDRQKWLYHKEHRSILAAYLKHLMIRNLQVFPSMLIGPGLFFRTLHGSEISFSCSKKTPGYIQADRARIIQSSMEFNVGIAYGIDQLLEPPDLGSRCDEFRPAVISSSECASCNYHPPCPLGSYEQGQSMSCSYYGQSLLSKKTIYDLVGKKSSLSQSSRRGNWWFLLTSLKGCKRMCVTPTWTSKCCENHYGINCQVCPGELEAPCSNHGTCDDGFHGSGRCTCSEAFTGTACEQCMPGRYGPECKECNCTENGICNEGSHGDGFCFCTSGWIGEHCDISLAVIPKCSPPCHRNAVCRFNNTCECNLHYEGDGMICTVIDMCGDDNGGCSDHANCTQTGTDISCTCSPNYQGDGYICIPIDRCADGNNGDCSEHATCISTGPNARRCECKAGYAGNGVQCLEEAIPPTDRCLEENGYCHFDAICTDLHFHDKTVGVFHLQSPKGKYNFTYQEAEASCAAEDATLATLQQLSAAQQMGFHLCIVGWLFNRTAGYPTVYPHAKCGTNHVGIVNYGFRSELNEKWDAYCYRAKDVQCDCRDGFWGDGYTCIGNLLTVLAQHANFSIYYSMLLDYANTTQEGLEFLNLLSDDTTYKTLFVPMNSGFKDNTSLTLNDLKLHVSVSDVALLSINLTAGTIITSQAGYGLSIADSMNNTHPPGSKMINNTLIVEWDIVASNGIIHAIEAPLMTPVQHKHVIQFLGDVKTSTSAVTIGASTVVAIVLLCIAIAGVSYYYLQKKNQGFQFRYLKAELEDEEPSPWQERNPALVSIPNPIYGASLYDEPFEDSANGENFSDTQEIFANQ